MVVVQHVECKTKSTENVFKSPNVVLYKQIGVNESNVSVKMLTGSS